MKTGTGIGLTILSFLFMAGCATLEPSEVKEEKSSHAVIQAVPVITHSFASKEMAPGDTWKVYLKVSDPQGAMKQIACTIEQPGIGTYPVSFIGIQDRENLSGYIYLNTVGIPNLNWVTLTLTVQIQDEDGIYSQPVTFPLSFDIRATQEAPPPGIFQEVDLGPIMITLRTLEGDHRRRFFEDD